MPIDTIYVPPPAPRADTALNVRDFGAQCDGVTDDTAAWQAALAAAANPNGLTTPNGTTKPPITFSGHCLVQPGVLVADAGQSILGSDPNNSILLHPGGGGQESYLLKVDTGHGNHAGVRLANFSIRGLSDLRTEVGGGLWLYQSSLVRLDNVRVRSIKGTATRIEGCWDCTFYSLFNENCGTETDATIPATLLTDSATDDIDNLQFFNLHTEAHQGVHLELRHQKDASERLHECRFFGAKVHGLQTAAGVPNVPLLKLGQYSSGSRWYGGLVAWGRGSQVEIASRYHQFDGLAFGGNGADATAVQHHVHLTATSGRNLFARTSVQVGNIGAEPFLADAGSNANATRDTVPATYGATAFAADAGTANVFEYRKLDDAREYLTGQKAFGGRVDHTTTLSTTSVYGFASAVGGAVDARLYRQGAGQVKLDDGAGGKGELWLGTSTSTANSILRLYGYSGANMLCDLSMGGAAFIVAGGAGTLNAIVRLNGSTNNLLNVDYGGNVVLGFGALATNASTGFLYLSGGAGPPTGTPTANAGRTPLYMDTTNNKLYAFLGGSWKSLAAFA